MEPGDRKKAWRKKSPTNGDQQGKIKRFWTERDPDIKRPDRVFGSSRDSQFDGGVSCSWRANSGQPERDPATGRRDPQFDLGVSCAPLANSGQIGTNVSSSCDASFASASCACGSPSCGVCASYHLALRPPLFILNEWTRVLLEKLLRLLTNFAVRRRESNRFLEPFVCFLYVSGPEIHNAQIEVPLHMLRIVL